MINAILIRIIGDNTGLKRTLQDTTRVVDRTTSGFGGLNGTLGGTTSQMSKTKIAAGALGTSLAAVGVLTVAAFAAATRMAADFDEEMRNVNSIAKQTPAAFAATESSVLALSKTLPKSAVDLASGLYDITSSGFSGAGALKVLKASAQDAVAGITTTSNAAQAVTASLNAYGLSADKAADVSDILFQTVNLGVIDFDTLSKNLGHVVSQAAAAKIPLQDVGAAIATMTLSGQTGDVAATSLNNYIARLVNPTAQLAALYKSLGYASGQAALEQDGLLGVTQKLRAATGGSLTGLQAVLQDSQAVRGAASLMTNDGTTYAKVSAQISDQAGRAGSAQSALAEQMKAVNNQYRLAVNGVRAFAIEQGLKLLPSVSAVLRAVTDLATDGMPVLSSALDHVLPLLRSVGDLGLNLGSILATIAKGVEPLAKALLKIGGAAILGALTGIVDALGAVTKVLADNPKVVLAVVAILVGRLIPALAASVFEFITLQAQLIATRINMAQLQLQAASASLGITTLGRAVSAAKIAGTASLSSLVGGLAGLAATGALVGVALAWQRVSSEEAKAAAEVATIQKAFDGLDPASIQDTSEALQKVIDKGAAREKHDEGLLTALFGGTPDWVKAIDAKTDEIFLGNHDISSGRDAAKALKADEKAAADATSNVNRLARAYGLTETQVKSLAKHNDVDLSKPWKKSSDEIAKFRSAVVGAAKDAGVTATSLGDIATAAGLTSASAIATFTKAVAALQKTTADAFASSTDVLGTLKVGGADADVASANKSLTEAQAKLAEVREAYAGMQVLPASAAKKIADATADVTTAQAAAAKAAKEASDDTLAGAYKNAITQATTFSADITKSLQMGLDPSVVAKLLAEGPAQATPILEQIVSDHTGNLVKLVNDSEAAIAKISAFTVEQARLTAIATNAVTDKLSGELPEAMQIASQKMQGVLDPAAIASALGTTAASVNQIATDFGITLGGSVAKGVADGLASGTASVDSFLKAYADAAAAARTGPGLDTNATGINATIFSAASASTAASTVKKKTTTPGASIQASTHGRFAGGGYVTGPGTPTSDSIDAKLSTQEFVQRASAVRKYGLGFMHAVNEGRFQIPRFAKGGYVGAAFSQPRVVTVTVPVSETHTSSAPISIGTVMAADVADFETQMSRRRRLAALGTAVGG